VTGVKGSNSRCFWIIWTKTWNCQCAGKKLFNPYITKTLLRRKPIKLCLHLNLV